MTSILLGHAPQDEARASLLADALSREGHRVERAGPDESGERLAEKAAGVDRVLALWSREATQPRLRALAALALAKGKLIQASLDGSEPPLALARHEQVALAGWNGEADHPGLRLLREQLVPAVSASPPLPPPSPSSSAPSSSPAPPAPASSPSGASNAVVILGVLVLVLGAGVAFLLTLGLGEIAPQGPPITTGAENPASPVSSAAPAAPASPGPVQPPATPDQEMAAGPAPASPAAPPPASASAAFPNQILPSSSHLYLTYDDLTGLSRAQLRLARNEIYARHGRIFSDPDLRAYFARFPWYRPRTAEVALTPVEQANVRLIQQVER